MQPMLANRTKQTKKATTQNNHGQQKTKGDVALPMADDVGATTSDAMGALPGDASSTTDDVGAATTKPTAVKSTK